MSRKGNDRIGPSRQERRLKRRKTAAYMMLGFMVAWIVAMLALELTIGFQKGFGTGFGDGLRVPPDIVDAAGVGSNVSAIVAATSHNVGDNGYLWDTLLIVSSLLAMLGITYFWYLVMSRIGAF